MGYGNEARIIYQPNPSKLFSAPAGWLSEANQFWEIRKWKLFSGKILRSALFTKCDEIWDSMKSMLLSCAKWEHKLQKLWLNIKWPWYCGAKQIKPCIILTHLDVFPNPRGKMGCSWQASRSVKSSLLWQDEKFLPGTADIEIWSHVNHQSY